jgi:hypothetical protein
MTRVTAVVAAVIPARSPLVPAILVVMIIGAHLAFRNRDKLSGSVTSSDQPQFDLLYVVGPWIAIVLLSLALLGWFTSGH